MSGDAEQSVCVRHRRTRWESGQKKNAVGPCLPHRVVLASWRMAQQLLSAHDTGSRVRYIPLADVPQKSRREEARLTKVC